MPVVPPGPLLFPEEMLSDYPRKLAIADFIRDYGWEVTPTSPVFAISAISGEGCQPLVFAIMEYLQQTRAEATSEEPEAPEAEA